MQAHSPNSFCRYSGLGRTLQIKKEWILIFWPYFSFLLFLFSPFFFCAASVQLGIDRLFEEGHYSLLDNKRVGLVTNHTGVNSQLRSTFEIFKEKTNLVALFTPEHGLDGASYAAEKVNHQAKGKISIYSLHGDTRRPTEEMLKGIQVLVYDMQEIGCRSYTYVSTLCYVMEEAAKQKIPLLVLDRPNPMGGEMIDGPLLEDKWRSFVGYLNVPYCHGMTIGEIALFFNREYHIGCNLHIIPMKGWKRTMTFAQTGLHWIPTSPYIPESDTPFYYASTGILGALGVVNIGIGYTLPFKIVGAPWIKGDEFASKLNEQNLPGVKFIPFSFKPFYGKFKGKYCQGIKILITDPQRYSPLSVQFMLIGLLKSMYPQSFQTHLSQMTKEARDLFSKVNGTDYILHLVEKEKFIAWKLISYDKKQREDFIKKRRQYLLYE